MMPSDIYGGITIQHVFRRPESTAELPYLIWVRYALLLRVFPKSAVIFRCIPISAVGVVFIRLEKDLSDFCLTVKL